MAFFALFLQPEWFRLLLYDLTTHWIAPAQLTTKKIHHWYAFTSGQIHNWCCFTVQSVEALFQKPSPQTRPPFAGPSVTARHRAVLFFTVACLLFACTKSECVADIVLPRTGNARGLDSHESVYLRASFFSTVQGSQTNRHATGGMKERARGFTAKVRNRIMHALTGNITEYEVYTPSSRKIWSRSFTLPNGMIVLSHSIRGRCAWIKFYRRGITKEMEFTKGEAPKLFGLLARAVASAGGEPGSCWPQHGNYKRLWKSLGVKLSSRTAPIQEAAKEEVPDHQWNPATDLLASVVSPTRTESFTNGQIYQWKHLPVVQTGPTARSQSARLDVTSDDPTQPLNLKPRGYQNRDTIGGCSRGQRSSQAKLLRFQRWTQNKRVRRQDYRAWKSELKGTTLRTHGGSIPIPPFSPSPTRIERLRSTVRRTQSSPSNWRYHQHSCPIPIKPHTTVRIATWNVEGLKEVAKYDQILLFAKKYDFHLLAIQETKSDSSHSFCKSGWEILHSSTPEGKHHGVGFMVSPFLRPFITDFLAHTPRICELTIQIIPHPITVFCVYAPSQVENSEEDLARKLEFWDALDTLISSHTNSEHLIVLGDFNARLAQDMDRDVPGLGPNVWGKRQALQDADRDNAEYLKDFINTYSLVHTPSHTQLPPRKLVTYKEMTCTDHSLDAPSTDNWAALDHVLITTALSEAFKFSGSLLQQMINTRHLPSYGVLSCQYPERSPPVKAPQLDYSNTKSFYSALEADLLAFTGYQMPDPPSPECPSSFFVVAYTDGSCPNNRIVSPDNPAGWGFAAMSSDTPTEPSQDTCWEISYGPVKTTPTDVTILPEVWGSNNTGELKALIELFDYLLYYANLPSRSDITIYTDSEYAMRLILGDSLPNTHHQLVTLAQQYFTALRTLHHVTLSKVAGHSGIIGNELADSLAKKGVNEYGSLGRFSGSRTAALSPPDIGYNTDQWLSLSPNEQNLRLMELIRKRTPLIPTLPVSPKKPWISPSTLEYITAFQTRTDLTGAEVKQYRNKIKKLARKDKKQCIMTHLREDFHGSAIQQWHTARSLRKDFRPAPTNLINTKGKLVSKAAARAETFAEYLANQVWKAPDDETKPFSPPLEEIPSSARPFTMEELNIVLRALGKRKASGPDAIPAELLQGAPYILRLYLLDHYNHCFQTGQAPSSWLHSEVVMLVKNYQKDTKLLSNYRPISLTNTMYKIYASLLQKRLAAHFDHRLRPTQFGFRSGRSVTQHIHILRRLLEVHERQTEAFHAIFLDWAKAFDSVTFSSIQSSLEYMGVPPSFRVAIASLYQNPTFTVRESQSHSEVYTQTSGLRQGCPLSPYLFGFVLTHLFESAESQYVAEHGIISGVLRLGTSLWDLEYADDTVLLSNSFSQAQLFLHLIQKEGARRGLVLNFDKCEQLALNSDQRVYYDPHYLPTQVDDLRVPMPEAVKYLGVYLDPKSNNHRNVSTRISRAMEASKKLSPLMKHGLLPPNWKLLVYRSVVQSILMYAMDSLLLTPALNEDGLGTL